MIFEFKFVYKLVLWIYLSQFWILCKNYFQWFRIIFNFKIQIYWKWISGDQCWIDINVVTTFVKTKEWQKMVWKWKWIVMDVKSCNQLRCDQCEMAITNTNHVKTIFDGINFSTALFVRVIFYYFLSKKKSILEIVILMMLFGKNN